MSKANKVPERGWPQLVMVRESLADLPPVSLPKGIRVRSYWPGACLEWNRLIGAAFGWKEGRDYFEEKMRRDSEYRPERVLFLVQRGRAVATASLWSDPLRGGEVGTLHYVAVDRCCAGMGLGLQVSLAALHEMVAEGRTRARLLTDDDRLAAVITYLRLGFVPEIVDENQRGRWRKIFKVLQLPDAEKRGLQKALRAPLVSEPKVPATQRVENNYGYTPLRRHNPNRENRGGPRGGGNPDFLSDETLFHSMDLGTTECSVSAVTAGSPIRKGLWFSFTAGSMGLAAGSEVHWSIRGQGAMGFGGQGDDPTGDNYISVEAPGGIACRVETSSAWLGFRLERGKLRPGETVRLTFNNLRREETNRYGYRWHPVAARRRLYVDVIRHPADPPLRLPAPLDIHFRPGPPRALEVVLPCTRRPKQDVRALVTLRDRHDNRVDHYRGPVQLRGANKSSETVHLVNGRVSTTCPVDSTSPVFQLEASCGAVKPTARSNPSLLSEDLHYYIGDLHCHDLLSESEGYTDEVYAFARDDRGLDFFSLSVQSHGWHSNEKHVLHKYFNERFLEEGYFVTLLAFEWQHSSFGDKVIHYLGGNHPVLPVEDPRFSSPAYLYEALRATDALIISHHPGYPLPRWVPGTDWSVVDNQIERCVEIWSCHGSSEGYDATDRPLRAVDPNHTAYAALRRGLRLGFVGGSDSHSGRPGGAVREPGPHRGGLAAVWAPELTRRSIYRGLYNRHTCALTGARIVVRMTVNDTLMGGETEAAEEAQIRVVVYAPGRLAKVEILKNTQLLKAFSVRGSEARIEMSDRTGGPAFYHCRVTQTDGELAVGSPVWVG